MRNADNLDRMLETAVAVALGVQTRPTMAGKVRHAPVKSRRRGNGQRETVRRRG